MQPIHNLVKCEKLYLWVGAGATNPPQSFKYKQEKLSYYLSKRQSALVNSQSMLWQLK